MAKKNVTIKLDDDIRKWLEQQAQKELRPVANYILKLIIEDYSQHQNMKGDLTHGK